jgi:uncharacterized RDD family membrane protein YckC
MEQATPAADLLQEFEEELNVDPVAKEVRFANYIIDRIVFYGFIFGGAFLWGIIMVSSDNYSDGDLDFDISYIADYLLTALAYFIFYTLIEGFSKGRSLGKLITGTVAVRNDGSPITFSDAMLRSLSRIVPLEPFSGFGEKPWHDSWSNTIVVKKKK